MKVSVNSPNHTKKIFKKTSLWDFIWHIVYAGNRAAKKPCKPVENTGLLRPGGNHISQCIWYKLWRRVPDAQANLHGSAKNGQNVDKKSKKKAASVR